MENISIRKATVGDLDRLQKLGIQTFTETFSAVNSAENMRQYLSEAFAIDRLATELNDPDSEFYFAELGQETIGYLKLNFGPSQTELKDDCTIEIERIYVLQAFQGKKIGQLLYEKAMEVAKSKNVDYIWLGVWEENIKAIRFYEKNGFEAFDKHLFKLGDEEQTDIMMKLRIAR